MKKKCNKFKKTCLTCNKIFYVFLSELNKKYCSHKCYNEIPRKKLGIIVKCKICNKEVYKFPKKISKFCSHKCYSEFLKISMKENNRGFQKGVKIIHSKETIRKISESQKGKKTGRIPKSAFKKGHKLRIGMKHTIKAKEKMSKVAKLSFKLGRKVWCEGKKNPNLAKDNSKFWKGGITSLHDEIRHSFETKQWRREIFKRDNLTCQDCFIRGGDLHAHHKKEFYIILQEFLNQYNQFSPIEDKEILIRLAINHKPFWDVNNGKTLCKECHKKTYGKIRRRLI